MFHTAHTLQLKPGKLAGYREAHQQLWPEIAQSMSSNGVSMAIYHHEERLFLFATAPSEADWERSREHPALAKWDATMTEYLVEKAPGEIAFHPPEKVFGFGQFAK